MFLRVVEWEAVSLFRSAVKATFPALKYRDYRLFFYAQCVSWTGSWMHRVALGFYVFQLTGSPILVGVVDAASRAPTILFSLLGGTLVDRYPKKKILLITQGLQFLIASLLGTLILTGHAGIETILVMVFLLGSIEAIDHPARLSLPVELVGKADLHAATALNMSIFNTARIVGPALAGWVIYAAGVGWAFVANGVSFLFPLIAFSYITFKPFVAPARESTVKAIRDGLRYAFHHKEIRLLLLYGSIIGIFGWSYNTIMPVIASEIFKTDAAGLGLLFSATGAGAVLGAVFVSAIGKYFSPHRLMLFGGILYSVALVIFPWAPYGPALVLLFLVGFGQAFQNSTLNARIQGLTADHVRGRVSSIQSLMIHGSQPLGSLQIGFAAATLGSATAVGISGAVVFVAALVLYSLVKALRASR